MKREVTTKGVTVQSDGRTADEQIKELRSVLRGALDYMKANWCPWDSIPISLNSNPKFGTVGDWMRKYNDKGELIK